MAAPGLEQDSLLDAAFEELGARGYDAASLDGIVSAAGLGKADLAVAVIERETARNIAAIGALRSPDTIDEFWVELKRIRTVVRELERGGLSRLMASISRRPEIVNRLESTIEMWRAKLSSLWRRGQELGTVRADLSLGVLITMAQGLRREAASTKLPVERAASDCELAAFDHFFDGLMQRVLELSRVPPPRRNR